MKKLTYLLIALAMLTGVASCSYTPEERAEKVVKEYCDAIKDGNNAKKSSLKYEPSEEVVPEAVEAVEDYVVLDVLPESDLGFPELIWGECVIDKNTDIRIIGADKIYSTEVDEETGERVINLGKNTIFNDTPDVISAFKVTVEAGNKKIIFGVVQLGEKNFKIYYTQGLYTYQRYLTDIKEKTGCEVEVPWARTDDDMGQYVCDMMGAIKTFDIFTTAISKNDTAAINALYPATKQSGFIIEGKSKPKHLSLSDSRATILTQDSLTVIISSDNLIVDSYGILSTADVEEALKAFDATPYSRENLSDKEYIRKLKDQLEELERAKRLEEEEKERKAKAAKYKAQGVALISSQFSSNGKGAKGVKYTAINLSNKTAKYITIEVVGYNSVDDPVWSDGYIKRCRGIGPIPPEEGGSWDFDDLWERGELVHSYEIKKLTIQFKDGTSKSVKLPQPLPSNWRDWLY